MERNLTCILCPRGCTLNVTVDGDNVFVTGNACPRGRHYGEEEVVAPKRTVTSIVRVSNREDVMVSVKTETPVAKSDIFKVMEEIRKTSVTAPVRVGDVILADVCGSNIIATKNID
jgi:CxxC motif-containing protein